MEITNNILVDFNSIVDIDIGLLYNIKYHYNNSKFIDTEYLNNIDENVLIYSLVKRENENPISLIINKEFIDNIDYLRDEFFNNDYDNILKYSRKTNIFNLMITYTSIDQIKINILCKNIKEEQFIKKYLHNTPIIISDNYTDIDISVYDTIFIKNYKDILNFNNLYAKNIYISKYNFNLDKDIPLKEISDKIADSNQLFTIDSYDTNLNALG